MSDEWGVEAGYTDAVGAKQSVAPKVIERMRAIIGRAPQGEPPVLLRRPGGLLPPGQAVVECEDGTEVCVSGELPADMPYGYHRLRPVPRRGAGGAGEQEARRLIVSPGRCYLPEDRQWGWAVQLYAARSRDSWGIGDLGDLARLGAWSAKHGAQILLVNPLHATAPVLPQQPSPYFPASRRFRNPMYLRIEDVPGSGESVKNLAELARRGHALNETHEIDRDAVWALKLAALELIWRERGPGADFDAWYRDAGADLRQFATWAALSEQHGQNWRTWPVQYRRPDAVAVTKFADERVDRVRFHAWLQRLLTDQLRAATTGLDVIQDLPIGVDPGGADAWAWQDLFAEGVTVGAPPDEFNTNGQDWGLPPFVPWRLAHAGYQPFIDVIRATLAAGGGLRVDHVMGLFRLWWIPAEGDATGGAYVRYPAQDLLDIIALESHRAGAVVVGEDLGTVEDSARKAMSEANLLSYRLLWFEKDDPSTWPVKAMAAITTHDLPTVAGLWDGSDLDEQRALGLEPNTESTNEIRTRLAGAGALPENATGPEAVLAAHRLLAQAPAMLLTATLEDALAEPRRPNIPGADNQRPNWSLALPLPLEELMDSSLALQLANTLGAATQSNQADAPC